MRRAITFILLTALVRVIFFIGGIDFLSRGADAALALIVSMLTALFLTFAISQVEK